MRGWILLLSMLIVGCATPRAIETSLRSGVDRAGLDRSVRPQDGYYAHVNGKHYARAAVVDAQPQDVVAELSLRTEARLHALTENLLTEPPATPQLPVVPLVEDEPQDRAVAQRDRAQVRDFYRSFMDVAALERLGIRPLRTLLAQVDAIDSASALQRFFGSAQLLPLALPIAISVAPALESTLEPAGTYVIRIAPSGLGLDDSDAYASSTPDKLRLRTAYADYLLTLLSLAGHRDAGREAAEVLAFEGQLARLQRQPQPTRAAPLGEPTQRFANAAALQAGASGIDWNAVVAASTLPTTHELVVVRPEYLRGLSKLLADQSLARWRLYLRVRALDAAAPYLNAAFADAHFGFHGVVEGGRTVRPERWRAAQDVLNLALGAQIGRLYTAEQLVPEAHARVLAIVLNIRAALLTHIDVATHMSSTARTAARARIAALDVHIARPASARDDNALYIRNDDLYGNVTRTARFHFNRARARLSGQRDEGSSLDPQAVEVRFCAGRNDLRVSAAILQTPLFDAAVDDALNYGAIGSVIGRELAQMLVHTAASRDGSARTTSTAPDEAAERLGLTLAWQGWQTSLGGGPAAVIEGFSGGERFFIGFARASRAGPPESQAARDVDTLLRDFAPFASTYSLRPGDAIYRPPARPVPRPPSPARSRAEDPICRGLAEA